MHTYPRTELKDQAVRKNIKLCGQFKASARVVLFFQVSFCAASAALHRRHLMVWKIFAPRFLFEAVGFLISIPIMLLGYGYFLRIDNTLRRWQKKLEEFVSAEFGRALQ